jgi:hypothetical protein
VEENYESAQKSKADIASAAAAAAEAAGAAESSKKLLEDKD